MTRRDGKEATELGGLSRREAISAAAVVAGFVLVPIAASAEAAAAFPVTVRISWRTGEAHSGGAATIAAVSAAIAPFSGAGGAVLVHRLA